MSGRAAVRLEPVLGGFMLLRECIPSVGSLCVSAFHQSGNLFFPKDGPTEQDANDESNQGWYPHPIDTTHHSVPHHAAAQRCSHHRPAAEEKEKHYYDDKGDDEDHFVCCVHKINPLARLRTSLEGSDQISQVVVADVPARHI